MRKLIALVLCLALFFTACQSSGGDANNSMIAVQDNQVQKSYCVLFWPDFNRKNLISSVESIALENDERLYEAIIKKLFENPPSMASKIFAENVNLNSVSINQNIVTVDLSSEFQTDMAEEDKFIAIMCMVNTLTSFSQVEYVCIKVNNEDIRLGRRPYGPLSRFSTDIDAESDAFRRGFNQQFTSGQQTEAFNATLFFCTKDKQYVVPEVRMVDVTDGDYIRKILNELSGGPSNSVDFVSAFNTSLNLNADNSDCIISSLKNNTSKLNIVLKDTSAFKDNNFKDPIVQASIFYSLEPFVDELEEIEVTYSSKQVTQTFTIVQKTDVKNFLGDYINMYMPKASHDGLKLTHGVIPVNAVNPEHKKLSLLIYNYVCTLYNDALRGADNNIIINKEQRDVYNHLADIMLEGGCDTDFSVSVANSTAQVSISKRLYTILKGLSDTEQKLFIYSVVNTLTESPEIKSVQLLVEGKRVTGQDEIAILIYNPLLRSQGMIDSN